MGVFGGLVKAVTRPQVDDRVIDAKKVFQFNNVSQSVTYMEIKRDILYTF